MAVRTFAAIVIGSTETEMRIYEYNGKKSMKQIDCINTRLQLGQETIRMGRLDADTVEKLCQTLRDFAKIMEGYQVEAYRCVATSALRAIRSSEITVDYIEKRTGLSIEVISNSEHRFLDYKSIAYESTSFEEIIQNGTAIVDIGASSMQISFFDKDKLVTTANIHAGKIVTQERYLSSAHSTGHYASLVHDILQHEMNGFYKLYQKSRPTKNLIIVDADLMEMFQRQSQEIRQLTREMGKDVFCMQADQFQMLYEKMLTLSSDEICSRFQIEADAALLVTQSMIFCHCLLESTGAETIWLMDVTICDGLAYNYGMEQKLLRQIHDFDEDILAAARNIAKRYKSNAAHVKHMEELTAEIFDKTKKIHGLSGRDKLLLKISAILHNCGKYISLTNVSDCAYNIIMATEIIGLSHNERSIIANVVKFNNQDFYYARERDGEDISKEDFLTIAKLTAILRLANALDRSHKQKFADAKVTLKGSDLIFTIDTAEDVTLERATLSMREDFFEEVFNVHPMIVQKKHIR